MKTHIFLILTLLFAVVHQISAHDKILLNNISGIFKIKNRTLIGQGQDQYNKSCVEGRAVIKFYSDCRDRALTFTAVQYMSWQYRPESELELEKFKTPNGGLSDFVGMFFNSLPVEKMGVLIQQ